MKKIAMPETADIQDELTPAELEIFEAETEKLKRELEGFFNHPPTGETEL